MSDELNYLLKDTISKWGHVLRFWGELDLQHINLWGDTIPPISGGNEGTHMTLRGEAALTLLACSSEQGESTFAPTRAIWSLKHHLWKKTSFVGHTNLSTEN